MALDLSACWRTSIWCRFTAAMITRFRCLVCGYPTSEAPQHSATVSRDTTLMQ